MGRPHEWFRVTQSYPPPARRGGPLANHHAKSTAQLEQLVDSMLATSAKTGINGSTLSDRSHVFTAVRSLPLGRRARGGGDRDITHAQVTRGLHGGGRPLAG
jgi:hypothetical protein